MLYRVAVPKQLVKLKFDFNCEQENDYTINLKVKTEFPSNLESWFENTIGYIPDVKMSMSEGSFYWIDFPDQLSGVAFQVAWC